MMGIRINNKNDNDKLGSSLLEWDLRLCWLSRRGKLCTEDIETFFTKVELKPRKDEVEIKNCILLAGKEFEIVLTDPTIS